MSIDYADKLDRHVEVSEGRLFGMKSHDCHVFMKPLLPIAFIDLLKPIWSPIVELSQFFRDLCSLTLWESELR